MTDLTLGGVAWCSTPRFRAIEERLPRTNYGDVLAAQGITTVALERATSSSTGQTVPVVLGGRAVTARRQRASRVARLDLVAGPNGAASLSPVAPAAGALAARHRSSSTPTGTAKQRWPDDPTSHVYQAAQVAADTRARLIDLGRLFIAEMVFSHPSKLESSAPRARPAGYTVVLHVLVIPPGGRARQARPRAATMCRETKIRERHRRLAELCSAQPIRWPTAPPLRRQQPKFAARGSSPQFSGVASSGAHAGSRDATLDVSRWE